MQLVWSSPLTFSSLKSTIVFEEKVHPFADPDFWGTYNTIKPEESIESAIQKYGVRLKIQDN